MNPVEAERWHIGFLREHGDCGHSASDYEDSAYYREYLAPRYDPKGAHRRIQSFLSLYEDIRREGLRTPIIAADVGVLDLGFQYFRFDGCHRVAACKVLGITRVTARIFDTEVVTLGSRMREWIRFDDRGRS